MKKELLERLIERVEADDADRRTHFEAPIPDPASAEVVAEVEDELGFELHPDLSELYQTVGNGGFGPCCGILGIGEGGALDDLGRTADDAYVTLREPNQEDSSWFWPVGVLPFHHHGCGIYSCIDCHSADAAMLRFDPNACEKWEEAWQPERRNLVSWLSAWLDGDELLECDQPFWVEARKRSRRLT
jgi:hypothetical protein